MMGSGRYGREDSEFHRFHYPGTETLINLLGIRDPKRLEVAERRFVRTRLHEGLPRATGPCTYPGFKAIHHHLFTVLRHRQKAAPSRDQAADRG